MVLDFLSHRIAALWHKPLVGLGIAALAAVSVLIPSSSGAEGVSLLTVFLAGLVFFLVVSFWWYTNKIPRNVKGKVGIAVAIVTDEEKEARQIEFDFIRVLRQLLQRDPGGANFKLVVLPSHVAEQIIDRESARHYMVATRCHLIIYGQAKLRHQDGQPVHILSLDGLVAHASIPAKVSRNLADDFRRVLPRRVLVSQESDWIAFEITSTWVDLSARYVIGIAAYLSGDAAYSERLLLQVEAALKTAQPQGLLQPMYRGLPYRIKQLYSDWLYELYDKYFMTRERRYVEAADPIADKLLARDPDSYVALLFKAIAEFVLRRDVVAATSIIGKCRRISDATWRYSLAFLQAYSGDLKSAHNEYKRAFRGRISSESVPIQTEEFIQIVIDEEPEQEQLHFCLGLINYNVKRDFVAAQRAFERFLRSSCINDYPWAKKKAEELLALCVREISDKAS